MKDKPATGVLYVVATPIGNLEDISARALRILREADLIVAEDTRTTLQLLRHFGIDTPLQSLHAHNERRHTERYLRMLQASKSLAMVSDAGTPLISDPGFALVRAAKQAAIPVVPVPGASALLAALSACGLPVDKFSFEGFLPAAAGARRRSLQLLQQEARTMVFFEAPHRIEASIADMVSVFGAERPASFAREISKLHETIHTATLGELMRFVKSDPNQRRGELVVCVQGAEPLDADTAAGLHVARILSRYLAPSQAASAAAEVSGADRKVIYRLLSAAGQSESQ